MTTNATPLGPVTQTPTGSIRGSSDNPRVITKAAIDMVAKSIARFGWQQPIVVDREGVIVAGHTRHLAAKQLGLSSVPVVVAEGLTPDEARAYRIADNRTGDFTSWDYPELVDQLDDLSAGFSDELALADWQSIVGEFEATYGEGAQEPPAPVEMPAHQSAPVSQGGGVEYPQADNSASSSPTYTQPAVAPGQVQPLGVTPEAIAQTIDAFEITVVCSTEQHAARVMAAIVDMDGVVDVRNKR